MDANVRLIGAVKARAKTYLRARCYELELEQKGVAPDMNYACAANDD